MKKCNKCGANVEDFNNFCMSCGGSDFSEAVQNTEQPVFTGQDQGNNKPFVQEEMGNGNILAGVVGAFLFSLIGGALYFVIYQAGVIAGICGLVIFVLANFGYGVFARTKNKACVAGLISSIAVTIVMIFLAEYFCISFEIYQVYKEYGINIFDAIRATPEFLAEPEVGEAVLGDLAFAYIFGFIASIRSIVSLVKSRKK